MKRFVIVCFSMFLLQNAVYAQNISSKIFKFEVPNTISILANDSMQGRRTFTPGIKKAAAFISNKFEKAGLKKWPGLSTYLQKFSMISVEPETVFIKWNGKMLSDKNLIETSTQKSISWSGKDNIKVDSIAGQADLRKKIRHYLHPDEDAIVWVSSDLKNTFFKLKKYLSGQRDFQGAPTVLFILADKPAQKFEIKVKNRMTKEETANVLGYLPGSTKPEEYVIFSAHYDHLGVDTMLEGDTIYNGANDDASGTTAVIALARYFSRKGDNARSLIFVAFTGEEEGGYGSTYFSKQLDPGKVMAMFNIEMIGTPSKWGENSAYITGYNYSDFGKILQKNLKNTDFSFYPDPYPKQHLFYRSDNATLARLGVPAHTISTAKMANELHYHKVSDEVSTLDIENMTRIIRAIALSAQSIISGTDTPARVEPGRLR